MRARLGFSVATTLEPEILILDEVFSVGDASFRRKAQARIEAMMSRCKLIAIVSHSTDFLRRLCTHTLWLERGQVRDFGDAEAVLGRYDGAMGKAGGPEPDEA
jgi:ABC-type polysaccharide/polyol phosphate transport system ATPase subunit